LTGGCYVTGYTEIKEKNMARNKIKKVSPKQIREMVSRIVVQFEPQRVILFGSYAVGRASPDSDVDLLVVMPVSGSKRQKRIELRMALHDIVASKDIIVVTPEEFDRRKNIVGTIEYPAARDGKVMYVQP
jgi:predicted nucleotidyltransferase